jgi:hypothetical protein
MTLEDMNQNSKARRRVTTEMLHQWRKGRLDNDGEDGPFDTYHCPTHGARRYSRGEVRQAESDETCLYVCTLCGQVVDPTPFEADTLENPT